MKPAKELYKGGTVFFFRPPTGETVELVVISSAGPLCVGRVYDYVKKEVVVGLYWIYIRNHGAKLGPFFAELGLADRAMKRILKHLGKEFFEQPLEWIARQDAVRDWLWANIGKNDDLIGGEWAKSEEDKEST